MPIDRDKIEEGVRLILEGVGDDPERDGVKGTPQRVADMYAEILAGIDGDARRSSRSSRAPTTTR